MPAVVCLNYEEYRTICCVSDKSQFVEVYGMKDLDKHTCRIALVQAEPVLFNKQTGSVQ